MTKVYAILNTETNEFEEFNGKSCWKTTGAAKLSYYATRKYTFIQFTKFDEQSILVIVELTEYYHMYKGLCE